MQRARRRSSQRGVLLVPMALAAIIIVTFMWALIYLGQIETRKDELQNASDARAMAAARIAQIDGIEGVCQHPVMRYLIAANRGGNAANQWNMDEGDCSCETVELPDGTERLRCSTALSTSYQGEQRILQFDQPVLLAHEGAVEIAQGTFDQAEERRPKFVLALDYSGSMRTSISGGNTRREALIAAITGLLDQRLRIEYGLVMFNHEVITSLPVDFDDQQADIRAAIGRAAGGGTEFSAPLGAATGLLAPLENTGYYVLFLSDGFPNNGAGPSIVAANQARNRDITVFTVNVGGDFGLMQDMAGPPGSPGEAGYAFDVRNNAQFQAVFRSIVGNILCSIGPLNPVPSQELDPAEIHVFIRAANGVETRMRYSNALGDLEDEYAYKYRRDENKIRITQRACDEVLDEGAVIVARYGSAHLVQ